LWWPFLKMATGRNFSMSGINSGHHNLPTYQMTLKSDNVEFVKWAVKIQHCPILSKFDMWVDNDVPNWFPSLNNFYRSPLSDNVDFLRYCGGHFEIGDR
jgi:hypothetical protein